MIENIKNINNIPNALIEGLGGCRCNSSSSGSNSPGFEIVMISLLNAVAKKKSTYNNGEISSNLVTQNTFQNSNKIESTNKDKNVSKNIEEAISTSSKKYGVDENLIRAIIKVESNFNPNVVSSAGAKGLMQLMPENCKDLGVENPFDIKQNIDGGTRHIKEYLDKYNGNVEMALMAYNGGPTRMAKRGVTSIEHIYKMPKETQNYVPKVMKYYRG